MEGNSSDLSDKIRKLLFAFVFVLIVLVLIGSLRTHNQVQKSRADGTFLHAEAVTFTQYSSEAAPTGIVYEYRFVIDAVKHADTLAFYITHHNIEVYLADECVYEETENGKQFHTTGGIWIMLPLYASDAGKEVRVVLSPLYHDYDGKQVDFLIGSELAIYKDVFYALLPELLLSLCVMLVGLFFLSIALYYSMRRESIFRLYFVGMLAVCAGVWRFTYGKFVYLLFADDSVFIFTLSVISLMLVALAMFNCVEPGESKKWKLAISYGSIIYCVMDVIQLILQALGVCDLRQLLKLTHAQIIVSAAFIFVSGMYAWFHNARQLTHPTERNYSWILGVGTLLDLLMYYLTASSVGLLFTLSAILCFAFLEGIRLLLCFNDQRHALEEMEINLRLSRTATMMSQIRSHFVFNILNAVSGMCKYDPEKADDTVVRFARYLRSNIDIMENDKNIPFAVDLKQLEDYIALEQVRFGDKVEFYTDIEIDTFLIPPLILQPVVENAIKHGVSKKVTGGTIILSTRDIGDTIVITVEDDGVGFAAENVNKENSVGLKNISFRLKYLVNGTLTVESQVGSGTIVTITIPKKENETCTSFM